MRTGKRTTRHVPAPDSATGPQGVGARVRVPARAFTAATVSVVIPCYNYGRFLQAAVNSALVQEGVSVQVIIVDDASTDDSLVTARRLAEGDDRISVLSHESNKGPVQTFNDGLDLVSGEFVVRLDADDLLTPGSLARAVAVAVAFPSVGLVYGHPIHFVKDPVPVARTNTLHWTIWPGQEWLARRCATATNVITAPEALMRASVVEKVGGQQQLSHSHDMEMWLRIAAFSDVAHVAGVDQAWHRDHPESLSAREVDIVRDLQDRREAFDFLFAGMAGTLPQSPILHASAKRALAREALQRACHDYDRGSGDNPRARAMAAFAIGVWPAVTGTRQWRAYQRRERIGAAVCGKLPWYGLQAIFRRLSADRTYRRWTKEGV